MTWAMHGLNSCDTCRKARRWLDEQGIAHDWRDLREAPPDRAQLQGWLRAAGAEALVNRRSTTWRGLSEAQRAAAAPGGDEAALLDLLAAQPALIKRPLFQRDGEVLLGFDERVRARLADAAG